MKRYFLLIWVAVAALAFAAIPADAFEATQRVEVHGDPCPPDRDWLSAKCGDSLYFTLNDDRGAPGGSGGGAASPPSNNNSKIPCKGAGLTGRPVIVTTGEKIKSEPDFNGWGLYGLGLTRTYRSMHPSGTLFGPNWLSTLDMPKLVLSNSTTVRTYAGNFTYWKNITLTHPDGTAYRYTGWPVDTDGLTPGVNYVVGATMNSGAASTGVITWDSANGTYELTQDKKIYSYGGDGLPQSVFDSITGNNIVFGNMPVGSGSFTISSSAGQQLVLTVNANHRVTQIVDSGGNTWRYEYNSAGMLSRVTSPGTSPDIRDYLYENTTAPNVSTLLTGIVINGVRYSRYDYDTQGRVSKSGLEGGEEVDTFVYGSGQTTQTDARGQSTIYTYASILGELKITGISRAGTSTCPLLLPKRSMMRTVI